jgi:hypothetical protein
MHSRSSVHFAGVQTFAVQVLNTGQSPSVLQPGTQTLATQVLGTPDVVARQSALVWHWMQAPLLQISPRGQSVLLLHCVTHRLLVQAYCDPSHAHSAAYVVQASDVPAS